MTAGSSRVRVHFRDEDLEVEAPAGTPLQDLADRSGADLTFGCRTGSCGTCRVRILSGAEHASPMEPEERDFLKALGAAPDERLACRISVLGDLELERAGFPGP